MRGLLLVLTLGLPTVAAAQDADPAGAAPTLPDTVWAIDDVETTRFLDAKTVGPRFEADEELEVLDVAGERYRVRQGDQYGWLPIASVTTDEPAAPGLDLSNLSFDPAAFGLPPAPGGGAGAGK